MLDRFELEFPTSWKTNAARLGFCCKPNSSMQVHNLRWRSMTEWPKEPRILSKCLYCVGIQHPEKSKKLRKEAGLDLTTMMKNNSIQHPSNSIQIIPFFFTLS